MFVGVLVTYLNVIELVVFDVLGAYLKTVYEAGRKTYPSFSVVQILF